MGKILSTARRAIRNFDVEHRAMKYIEKSKTEARAAPKHPNTPAEVHLTEKDMIVLTQRSPSLDQRVGQFTIFSSVMKDGVLPDGVDYVKESTRRLPQKLHTLDHFLEPHVDFGFVVPEVVPQGRLIMRQAVNMIKAYQVQQTSLEELAVANKLEEKVAQAIVNRFVLFNVTPHQCWMPPAFLLELSKDTEASSRSQPMTLLDFALPRKRVNRDDVEFLGGDGQKTRREVFHGLPKE